MEPGLDQLPRPPVACPPAVLWSGFLRGDVDQPTLESLSGHLSDCMACLSLVETSSSRSWSRKRAVVRSPYLSEPHCEQLLQRALLLRLDEGAVLDFTEDQARTRDAEPLPEQLGRYRVRSLLGSGGFGRVYLADDPLLQRSVAIKVPRRNLFGTIGEMSDFLNEARHAAALDHPGIVPIFDVLGDEAGHALIVMKHIEGRTLSSVRRQGPLPLVQAVSLIALIARAVDFAHQRGFVHRDLKPSNILIDTTGQPHVTDFGLGIELGRTSQEEIGPAGTPTYMAPEQVRHDVSAIGPATDVWALGVMLAVLVTPQSPFQATTRQEQFDRILNSPPDLTTIADTSLQRILQRCLVKESRERTDSALKLAEQLEDWLHRHRLTAGTMSLRAKLVSVCVLMALLAGAAYWRSRDLAETLSNAQVDPTIHSTTSPVSPESDQSVAATKVPEPSPSSIPESESTRAVPAAAFNSKQREALSKLYALDMKQAFEASATGDVTRLKALLEGQVPEDGQPDVRGFEWHFLQQTMVPPHRTKKFTLWMGHTLDVSPDGNQIAVGGPFALKLLNTRTLETEHSFVPVVEELRALAYSPDGALLAGTGHQGNVIVWDIAKKKQTISHKAFEKNGWGIKFTPDGQRLVACAGDGSIKVWKVNESELEPIHNLKMEIKPDGVLGCLDLSPNGTLLATGSRDYHRVVFWNLEAGKSLGEWGFDAPASAVRFSRNGERLFVGAGNRMLYAVSTSDLQKQRHEWEESYSKPIREVEVSSDESLVAIGGRDGEIQIFRMPPNWNNTRLTNTVLKSWPAHAPHLMDLKFLPDGHSLVSTGDDSQLHVWDLRDVTTVQPLKQPEMNGTQQRLVKFAPSQGSLASTDQSPHLLVADDRGLHVRDSESDEVVQTLEEVGAAVDAPMGEYVRLATSANGRVAVLRKGGQVTWWDHAGDSSSTPLRHDLGSDEQNGGIAMSPDGRWLLIGKLSHDIHELHDLNGIDAPQSFDLINLGTVQFSPDSRQLIAIQTMNLCRHDVETRSKLFEVKAHTTHIHALAIDPQDIVIATGSQNFEIKLWNSQTGKLLKSLPTGAQPVLALAFSPDGRSLISADASYTNRIWNVETGQYLGNLPSSRHWTNQLELSGDGRHLLLRDTFHRFFLFRMPQ